MISSSRDRLANIETEYLSLKSKIDQVRSKVFQGLAPLYEKRDRLILKIQYCKMYIEVLLGEGEGEAKNVEEEFGEADQKKKQEYKETAQALTNKREITKEEEIRLKKIWKQLARVYHPDKFMGDPDKEEAYNQLMAEINQAKEYNDISKMEEIASDPEAYLAQKVFGSFDLKDDGKVIDLQKVWTALQDQILFAMEGLEQLRESPDHDLYKIASNQPAIIDKVIESRAKELNNKIHKLQKEADVIGKEISELGGCM